VPLRQSRDPADVPRISQPTLWQLLLRWGETLCFCGTAPVRGLWPYSSLRRHIGDYVAVVERYGQGEQKNSWENPVPVRLCPTHIPHGLTRVLTLASAVTGRRQTAWTMARVAINTWVKSRRPSDVSWRSERASIDGRWLFRVRRTVLPAGMKGKSVPLHVMEAFGGRGSIAPTHSRPRH
jgi:hypothetical protein